MGGGHCTAYTGHRVQSSNRRVAAEPGAAGADGQIAAGVVRCLAFTVPAAVVICKHERPRGYQEAESDFRVFSHAINRYYSRSARAFKDKFWGAEIFC